VDYASHDFDAAQIEPQWHFWISYGIDTPPNKDNVMVDNRSWASKHHIPNRTFGPGAYTTFNTVKPKIDSWQPVAIPR
jgi:NADH dehydrogenase [ubiquinone] 1 alpha subcomplex assembly factor 2